MRPGNSIISMLRASVKPHGSYVTAHQPAGQGLSYPADIESSILSAEPINRRFLVLPSAYDDLDIDFIGIRSGSEISSTRQSARDDVEVSTVGGLVSRMRITAGVMLPSDVPIHLICGSKDVVHSWAVPSLSIKVDCIPGYNCHRRLLIRWRGLF